MKKLPLIMFMLILASSCVACSSNKTNDSSNSNSTTDSVVETTSTDSNTTESEDTTPTGSDEQEIKEIPMDDAYLAKILTIEDTVPEYKVKDTITDSEFIGLWECQVAVNGETAYSGMMGAPLYATDRLEIKDDKTGKVINTTGSKTGYITNETDFTWKFADNKFTITIGTGDDAYDIEMNMTPDNQIVLKTVDPTNSEVYVYYSKVDKFTDFDFNSIKFNTDDLAK